MPLLDTIKLSLLKRSIIRYNKPLYEIFFESINKEINECWLWTGLTDKSGYGVLGNQKTSKYTIGAHRFSWLLHYGRIPDGMFVCHNCPDGDNPSCVNPEHLFLGFPEDNNLDYQIKKAKLVLDALNGRKEKRVLNQSRHLRGKKWPTLAQWASSNRLSLLKAHKYVNNGFLEFTTAGGVTRVNPKSFDANSIIVP